MNTIADRRERRIAIELDAIVHSPQGRTWACAIRDFCESGMLLQGAAGVGARSLRETGSDVRRGDEVNIHFSVPGDAAAQNFRVVGQVARVMDNAIGIYFPDGIAMRAFRALDGYASSREFREAGDTYGDGTADASGASKIDPEVAAKVLGEIRGLAERALPQLFGAFFERAAEELLILARDAGSNVRQNMLFEALNGVEHAAPEVSMDAVRRIIERIESRSERSPIAQKQAGAAPASGLSLVDNDQFEEWLAVADVISKAENRFSDELMGLCLQMSLLTPGWREKEVMPLAPASIASAFDDGMRQMQLERDVRQLLYSYFRDALSAFLRKLYPALSKILDESGAFPSSEEIASEARRRSARPTPVARPAAPPPEPEEPDTSDADYDFGESDFGRSASGAPGSGAPGSGAPGSGAPGSGAPAFGGSGAPGSGQQDRGPVAGGPPGTGHAGQGGPHTGGPQTGGPQTGGPHAGGPQSYGPQTGVPQSYGPQTDGPYQGGPQTGGPQTGGPQTGGPQTGGPRTGGPQSGGPQQPGQRAGGPYSAGAVHASGQLMGDMYGTARELMQLRRGLPGPDGLPGEMPWGPTVQGGSPESTWTREEVRSALNALASRQAASGGRMLEQEPGLARRVAQALSQQGGDKMLPPEARDALEIVDGLIGSIRADAYVPESAKHWFDGLEVTFGKLATEDGDFLDTSADPMHPALRLLNGLAELGNAADAGDGIDPALRAQVDAILTRTAAEYDGDPAVFERALADLSPLVERQRRAFEGNLQRVVRQSEGANRLVSARRAVVQQMDDRLTGREIPQLLVDLMNPGWRNLLVHTHLRYGEGSPEYRENLKVVDDVLQAIETGSGDAEKIIDRITRGLESISFEPGRRRQLITGIEDAIAGRSAGPKVHIEPGSVIDVLGLADQLPEVAPEIAADDQGARERWEHHLSVARELEVGSWLGVDDDAGRTRILTVAWIGDEHSAFTLVNRKGVKVHDYDLREMVQGLVDDRIQVLSEFDMPLMERASQTMLQNMHNQLAYQATHDALTGLLNRKEYERAVAEAVRESGREGAEGAVLFMDLDQFKIINNTAGHDAGDELLRAIVPNLRYELRGVRGTLARLGGDEFGVLLERCSAEQSLAAAEALLRAVREFRFEWKEQEYALTASIGFVAFGDDDREAATLLQQADSACYAAKDGGRNRILVFEVEDQRMARRRGVMEWVQKVDRVLRDGRIRLTAQKIQPIRDPQALPHYEILMTVLNESGDPMPPIDFITAAETYDRMPLVDRWVVRHALDWMASNLTRLRHVDGFSINLSGTSLNDPGFLDYVVQQLTASRVPTSKITFEITETAAIGSMDGANRFIRRLKDIGCTFSLDDFGTGLSSYSYLRNLEVDYVKIDGVFVKDLVDSPADYAVVKSVNEIAHFMGKRTVAEFVETEAIIESLKEIGVDYAQGWGVERPKPLADFFK